MAQRPQPEKAYFGKKDVAKLKKRVEEKKNELAKEELEKLKALHWQRCPGCGFKFEEFMFRGLHISKCFNCEGVFLEKGMLEKLCGKENKFIDGLLSLFSFDKDTYEK